MSYNSIQATNKLGFAVQNRAQKNRKAEATRMLALRTKEQDVPPIGENSVAAYAANFTYSDYESINVAHPKTGQMTPYRELCAMLAAPMPNTRMHVLHALQGIADECLEIHEAFNDYVFPPDSDASCESVVSINGQSFPISRALRYELGDLLWFISLYEHTTGYPALAGLQYLDGEASCSAQFINPALLSVASGAITQVKKEIFYGKEIPLEVSHEIVDRAISVVHEFIAHSSDCCLDDDRKRGYYEYLTRVMQDNVKKLSHRYKDAVWSQDEAINRNVAAE